MNETRPWTGQNRMDMYDPWQAYEMMLRSRGYEELVRELWKEGHIAAEMHLGLGEEAIMAGILSQIQEGDALAVDHRGTAPFLLRGVDPLTLILEIMGHPEGLCKGHGGHMHLFSKDHLAASSGIVGSAGPAAVGFGLAIQYQKTPHVAVAFFGEGSMNQGMLMEAMNLASVWRLPVLFVCKDNGWAITTKSSEMTAGDLTLRAQNMGLDTREVNGLDVSAVWQVTQTIFSEIRSNPHPFFLRAQCSHQEGHFLGDPLLRFYKSTRTFLGEWMGSLTKSTLSVHGAGLHKRLASLGKIFSLIIQIKDQTRSKHDPVLLLKHTLEKTAEDRARTETIENQIEHELEILLTQILVKLAEWQPTISREGDDQ